jgi:hypothetical protein
VNIPSVNPLKAALKNNWSVLLAYAVSLSLFVALYTYKLSALTGQKASFLEKNSLLQGSSWHAIYYNPLNAPYFITLRFLRYLHGGLLTIRLASIIWALVATYILFLVVRRLHGKFIGLLGAILFAASAWVLHIGRFVGPDVLLLSAGLVILLLFLRKKPGEAKNTITHSYPLWFLLVIVVGELYVPGVVWLIMLSAIIRPHVLRGAWVKASVLQRSLSLLIALILLAPFIRASLKQPKVFLLNWLGVDPKHAHLGHIIHQFVLVPNYLFWHGPQAPVIWLGHLPLIEITTAMFAIAGIYYYMRRFSQTNILLIIPAMAWILISLGGGTLLTLITAFIYVYATGGIAYVLKLWQRVFPRNPIAKNVAITIIIAIVGLVTIYNTREYFIAWAYNDATKAAYQQKL